MRTCCSVLSTPRLQRELNVPGWQGHYGYLQAGNMSANGSTSLLFMVFLLLAFNFKCQTLDFNEAIPLTSDVNQQLQRITLPFLSIYIYFFSVYRCLESGYNRWVLEHNNSNLQSVQFALNDGELGDKLLAR